MEILTSIFPAATIQLGNGTFLEDNLIGYVQLLQDGGLHYTESFDVKHFENKGYRSTLIKEAFN